MLKPTGERFLPFISPSVSGAKIHYEHLHRYAFASQFVSGRAVLDLASGEGYGSFILADHALSVTGIDIDPSTVMHASERYKKENLEFREGSITRVPSPGEKKFDVIVCFEAIEHIEDHEKLLKEIKRLLKDGGLLIISTPDKQVYSVEHDFCNPFHKKELNRDEFQNLLGTYFANVRIFGQNFISGCSIYPLDPCTTGSTDEIFVRLKDDQMVFMTAPEKKPEYFIALASDNSLDIIRPAKSNLIDISNAEIAVLLKRIEECQNCIHQKEAIITEQNTVLSEYGIDTNRKKRIFYKIMVKIFNTFFK